MAHQQAVAFHLPAIQRKYMVPGSPHAVWQCWEERSNLGWKTPRWPSITRRCKKRKLSCWPSYSSGMPFWVRAPPDVFHGAVKELHECLDPMVEEGDLFNMEQEIWEGIRKDPVAATTSTRATTPKRSPSLKRVPSQTPRVEEFTHSTSPDPPSMPEPGAAPPQDLALVSRRWSPPPPQFFLQDLDDLTMQPLEDAYLPRTMTLLDLPMLESLEITMSHTLAMGKVQYCLQAQSFIQMSLPRNSSQVQLGPSPKDKEPWANIMLHYIMETPVPSIDQSEYPLSQWSEL